jgi:hypothetical protein
MDIERLTKSQIVLLTLLTSFVTSIATGIVAVTLMEQAPPAITQTVNRIVERTVEKVVPEAMGQVAGAAVTERVVIREQDLVAEALTTVEPSVVRLFTPGKDENGKEIELFAGIAIVESQNGVLVADIATPAGPLSALRSDGIRVSVSVIKSESEKKDKLVRLQAATSTKVEDEEGGVKELPWIPAKISSQLPALGQSVVAIGGRASTRLAAGIITAISEKSAEDARGQMLETSIPGDSFSAGSPLMNSKGEIVAIATRESRTSGSEFLAFASIPWYNDEVKSEEVAEKSSQTAQP